MVDGAALTACCPACSLAALRCTQFSGLGARDGGVWSSPMRVPLSRCGRPRPAVHWQQKSAAKARNAPHVNQTGVRVETVRPCPARALLGVPPVLVETEPRDRPRAPKRRTRRPKGHIITHYQTTTYCCARAWRNRIAARASRSAASTSFGAAWAFSTSSKPRR